MKQIIYILILALTYAMISGALMVRLSPNALADGLDGLNCYQMSKHYSETGEGWRQECGIKPGHDFEPLLFETELKRDCERTIKKIMARPGASWNSEWGWAPEDRCWDYWPKEAYQ